MRSSTLLRRLLLGLDRDGHLVHGELLVEDALLLVVHAGHDRRHVEDDSAGEPDAAGEKRVLADPVAKIVGEAVAASRGALCGRLGGGTVTVPR